MDWLGKANSACDGGWPTTPISILLATDKGGVAPGACGGWPTIPNSILFATDRGGVGACACGATASDGARAAVGWLAPCVSGDGGGLFVIREAPRRSAVRCYEV